MSNEQHACTYRVFQEESALLQKYYLILNVIDVIKNTYMLFHCSTVHVALIITLIFQLMQTIYAL